MYICLFLIMSIWCHEFSIALLVRDNEKFAMCTFMFTVNVSTVLMKFHAGCVATMQHLLLHWGVFASTVVDSYVYVVY